MRRMWGLVAALLLALSVAGPAAAAAPDYVFPAGIACQFPLGYTQADALPNVWRDFTDEEGTVTWSLLAGRGGSITFTNMRTGATYSTATTGTHARYLYHEDGSTTMYAAGGWIQIQFPTDKPAGPSTTQVIGSMVVQIAADGMTTITRMSAHQIDICAALS